MRQAEQATHPGVIGLIPIDVQEGAILVLGSYALVLASEGLQATARLRLQKSTGLCIRLGAHQRSSVSWAVAGLEQQLTGSMSSRMPVSCASTVCHLSFTSEKGMNKLYKVNSLCAAQHSLLLQATLAQLKTGLCWPRGQSSKACTPCKACSPLPCT